MSRSCVVALAMVASSALIGPVSADFPCEERRLGARHYDMEWRWSDLTPYDLDDDGQLDLLASADGALLQYQCGSGAVPLRLEDHTPALDARFRAVADLNHDGRPDLVVFSASGHGHVVLRSDEPSFAPALDLIALPSITVDGLAIGDIDDDGHLDIVTRDGDGLSDLFHLRRGDGTGHFAVPELLLAGGRFEGFAFADVDLDGLTDFVAVSRALDQTILRRGQPGIAFAPIESLIATERHDRVEIADLDADGDLDIVQSLSPEPYVAVIRNENGTLAPPELIPVGVAPQLLTLADMNADGLLDLIAGSAQLSVFHATRDETFELAATTPSIMANFGTYRVLAIDIDGDERLDLLTSGSYRASISLQDRLGGFNGSTLYPVSGTSPRHVALGDVNLDGHLDLVHTVAQRSALDVRFGAGDGTFGPLSEAIVAAPPTGVALADFNGDGQLDLAATSHDAELMTVLLGRPGGTFELSQMLPVPKYGRSVSAGDLDGDGIIDLATTGGGDGYPPSTEIFRNTGDGTFSHWQTLLPGASGSDERILDLDSDGWNDVVVNLDASSLKVYWGSDEGLTEATAYSFPDVGFYRFATGDMDGDRMTDIISIGLYVDQLSILSQSEPRRFTLTESVPISSSSSSLAVADINHDGALDVFRTVANGRLGVYLGTGNGTLHAVRQFFGAAYAPPAFADLDGNGTLDVVVADARMDLIAVHLNRCTTCPDDFDADHAIGWSDLLLMLGAWESDATPFDLDHDGTVGPFDLTALLTHWGTCR